eukprot:1212895-Amphidinium_carterae.2
MFLGIVSVAGMVAVGLYITQSVARFFICSLVRMVGKGNTTGSSKVVIEVKGDMGFLCTAGTPVGSLDLLVEVVGSLVRRSSHSRHHSLGCYGHESQLVGLRLVDWMLVLSSQLTVAGWYWLWCELRTLASVNRCVQFDIELDITVVLNIVHSFCTLLCSASPSNVVITSLDRPTVHPEWVGAKPLNRNWSSIRELAPEWLQL